MPPTPISTQPLSWSKTIEQFLNQGGRFAKTTVSAYRPALRRFSEISRDLGYETPDQIDSALLERYGRALQDWGAAPRTINLHIVCTRRFIGWLKAHGARDLPEAWQVTQILPSAQKVEGGVSATSRPDLKRLLVASDGTPRDRAIWALAAFAGLRASEIAKLELDGIQKGEGGWAVRVKRGRRGIERWIPMVEEVTRAVSGYLNETGRALGRAKGFVFEASDPYAEKRATQGLSRQTVYNVIRKTAGEAGITNCNPRELRNAFAVLFLRAGGEISELSELLGHESPAQTAIFLEAQTRSIARETIERQLALVKNTDNVLMSEPADGLSPDQSSDEEDPSSPNA